MNLAILIACFNEGERLGRFLSELAAHLERTPLKGIEKVDVIVVDDGSREPVKLRDTPLRTHLLRHLVNLGQGAALQTGLEFARDVLRADLFVTMDADGQHRPEDLPELLGPVLAGTAEFAFGNRFLGAVLEVPLARKLLLKLAIGFEVALTGVRTTDSHNGYRAFSRAAAGKIELKQNRMAHATEFKQLVAARGIRYVEVPVSIRYSEETLRKGQSNWGSLRILRDLAKLYLFDRGSS
ncbi:MAG: glycosyltransferase family 2 protein [Oligoflexia bacterium]|nr:glycosyltransferase family 2 protein [Oligoflexia bacterium]